MPAIYTQDFDGSTSLPSGWTATAGVGATWSIVQSAGGLAPTSSPNALQIDDATGGGFDFLTYGTADGHGGNVTASSDVYSASSDIAYGVFLRGSSATMTSSSSAYCFYYSSPVSAAIIGKLSGGSLAILASVSAPSGASSWLTLSPTANGPSLSLEVYDRGTGQYLQPGGTWGTNQGPAVTATDSTISGSGYYGLFGSSRSSAFTADFDTFSVSAVGFALPFLEPWDEVTAPAIPSGWSSPDAGVWSTTTTTSGVTPTSSPNMLQASGVSAPTFLTYGTMDGNGGNVVASTNIQASGGTIGAAVRVSAAGSDTASCYCGWATPGSSEVGISRWSAGAETVLATLAAASWPASPGWVRITFTANGSSLSLQAQDLTSGDYLGPTGAWQASQTTALTVTDTTIGGEGYFGLIVHP